MKAQQVIQQHFTGIYGSQYQFVELMAYALAALVMGIVIWRWTQYKMRKDLEKRERDRMFDQKFAKQWRKRN